MFGLEDLVYRVYCFYREDIFLYMLLELGDLLVSRECVRKEGNRRIYL